MVKYNIAFVISQSKAKFPYAEAVTSKNIYIRFHGPKDVYASAYTDKMLKDFAKKFKARIKEDIIYGCFSTMMCMLMLKQCEKTYANDGIKQIVKRETTNVKISIQVETQIAP